MRNKKDIENFNEALESLNALNNPYFTWKQTTARKPHKDEFGQMIEEGEDYFSISLPGALSKYLRLSRKSMETYLKLLFTCAPGLQDLAAITMKDQDEEVREAVRKMESYVTQLEQSKSCDAP